MSRLEHASANVLQCLMNDVMPDECMAIELESSLNEYREQSKAASEDQPIFDMLKGILEHRTDAANDVHSLLKVIERMERMHPGCNFEPALIYLARIDKGLQLIEAAAGVSTPPPPQFACDQCSDTGELVYGVGRSMPCGCQNGKAEG